MMMTSGYVARGRGVAVSNWPSGSDVVLLDDEGEEEKGRQRRQQRQLRSDLFLGWPAAALKGKGNTKERR